MKFQYDIYGRLIPLRQILKEQKCNERYKRKSLTEMRKYLKSKGVNICEKEKKDYQ